MSNWAAWQNSESAGHFRTPGWRALPLCRLYYTFAGAIWERELVPMMQSEGLGLMVWSPLAGGLLSGKYDRDGQSASGGRRQEFDFPPVNRARALTVLDVMREIAEAKGVSVAQIALVRRCTSRR